MIEFLTLFLGLNVGATTVEVALSRPAAAVELRLDGRSIGRRSSEPWRFDCDFGHQLRPHRLEAIAYGPQGRELGHARQWVNYTRRSEEAAIVLVPVASGPPRDGRVVWAAAGNVRPRAIEVSFDGETVEVDASGRFRLPPYDLAQVHHLQLHLPAAGRPRRDLPLPRRRARLLSRRLLAAVHPVPPAARAPHPAAALVEPGARRNPRRRRQEAAGGGAGAEPQAEGREQHRLRPGAGVPRLPPGAALRLGAAEKVFERLGAEPPERAFTGVQGMLDMFAAIEASLASQRMVWVEGQYLPNEIVLTDAAPAGVRMAP